MKVFRPHLSTLFALLFFAGFADLARATIYYVENATQFNAGVDKNGARFSTLSAGDRVYLKGGTWGGLIRTLTGSMTDAEAQSNPAMILACDADYKPTPGGVTITGLCKIDLAGRGIVLGGLTFAPTSGMYKAGAYTDYSGASSSAYIIELDGGSRYMRLTHLKFDYCGRDNTDYANNDHYGAWLAINGYHHTVEYCEMAGRDFNPADITNPDPLRRTSIRQATITVYRSNNDTVDWGYHTIRRCFFGERKIPLGDDPRLYVAADGSLPADLSNGWETIRVGNSSLASVDMNTTVEYNVFYHAIQAVDGGPSDKSGEPEMISNKSRRNTYRYNTILNNYGQLCLRQGDYCVVQGNAFIAGGAYDASGAIVLTEQRNDRMGGVRAFGYGHVIANNYFYKISGEGIHSALCLGSGSTPTGTLEASLNGDAAAGYEPFNYGHVLGNTFIDCTAVTLDNPNGQIYPVYGTRFLNNLLHYSANIGAVGVTGHTDALANRGGYAAGNWVYSANSAQRSGAVTMLGTAANTISGSAANDPLMTRLYDVLSVPAAASPIHGRAVAVPVAVDTTSESANYDLAAKVAAQANIDYRGLARPAGARDVGSFEDLAAGIGFRPLRRNEVGIVTATYPELPVVAGLVISDLARVYDGTPKPVTVTTNPAGLFVSLTYNGSPTAPSAIGSYAVVGTVVDAVYTGSASATLVIAPDATVFNTAGPATWTCPPGVTSVQVECWGGGGAGGSALRTPNSGSVQYSGGGAGGAYARVAAYTVRPGTVYFINVGAGGIAATGTLPAGNTAAAAGGDSWFHFANAVSNTILARGGAGGTNAVGNTGATALGAGGLGSASGSLGDLVFSGGSGATGSSTTGAAFGGGGGGGGAPGGPGNAAVAGSGFGAAAVNGGGNGGNPNTTSGSSSPGQTPTNPPGGGGGGARASTQQSGGNGAAGRVVLTVTGITPAASWRQAIWGSPADAGDAADAADPDGDGRSNAQEYVLGSLPLSPETDPALSLSASGTTLSAGFVARAATGIGYAGYVRRHTLETAPEASGPWAEVPACIGVIGAGQTVTTALPIPAAKAFYRLRVWLE